MHRWLTVDVNMLVWWRSWFSDFNFANGPTALRSALTKTLRIWLLVLVPLPPFIYSFFSVFFFGFSLKPLLFLFCFFLACVLLHVIWSAYNCPAVSLGERRRKSAIVAQAEATLRTGAVRGPGWAGTRTTTTKNSLGSPWPHCLLMSKMLLRTVCLHLLSFFAAAQLFHVSLSHYGVSFHPFVITGTVWACWCQQCASSRAPLMLHIIPPSDHQCFWILAPLCYFPLFTLSFCIAW